MKTIRVAAAVIADTLPNPGKIFAAARGYGEQKGGWEFPGGKIEPGETPQQALLREIREELAVTVTVGPYLDTISWDYPAFHLEMDCFWCTIASGTLTLNEAQDARWLTAGDLNTVPWLPADRTILPKIAEAMQSEP